MCTSGPQRKPQSGVNETCYENAKLCGLGARASAETAKHLLRFACLETRPHLHAQLDSTRLFVLSCVLPRLLSYCLHANMFAGLLACSFPYLLACLLPFSFPYMLAHILGCVLDCLHTCLLVLLLASCLDVSCMLARLILCLPPLLHDCLLTWLDGCLLASLLACLLFCRGVA